MWYIRSLSAGAHCINQRSLIDKPQCTARVCGALYAMHHLIETISACSGVLTLHHVAAFHSSLVRWCKSGSLIKIMQTCRLGNWMIVKTAISNVVIRPHKLNYKFLIPRLCDLNNNCLINMVEYDVAYLSPNCLENWCVIASMRF